jgi:hypothetical protein
MQSYGLLDFREFNVRPVIVTGELKSLDNCDIGANNSYTFKPFQDFYKDETVVPYMDLL